MIVGCTIHRLEHNKFNFTIVLLSKSYRNWMLKIDFSIQCQWSWLDEYIGYEKAANIVCVYNCTLHKETVLIWIDLVFLVLIYGFTRENLSYSTYARLFDEIILKWTVCISGSISDRRELKDARKWQRYESPNENLQIPYFSNNIVTLPNCHRS